MRLTRTDSKYTSMDSHIEAVNLWLKDNVQVYSNPKLIVLSNFIVDWSSASGSFELAIDGVLLDDRIKFAPEMSGKSTLYYPVFNSPLGAPASYGKYEIHWQVQNLILKAVQETIPRFLGVYCDNQRNPLTEDVLNNIKHKVSDNEFSVKLDVNIVYTD